MSKKRFELTTIKNIETIQNLNIAWFVLALLGAIGGAIACFISADTLGEIYYSYAGYLLGSIIPICFLFIAIRAFIGGLYDAKAIRAIHGEKEGEISQSEKTECSVYSCEHTTIIFVNDRYTMIENGEVGFSGKAIKNADNTIVLITADNSRQMVLAVQNGCLVSKSGTVYKKVASV